MKNSYCEPTQCPPRVPGQCLTHTRTFQPPDRVQKLPVALNVAPIGLFPLDAETRFECTTSSSMQDMWLIKFPLWCLFWKYAILISAPSLKLSFETLTLSVFVDTVNSQCLYIEPLFFSSRLNVYSSLCVCPNGRGFKVEVHRCSMSRG